MATKHSKTVLEQKAQSMLAGWQQQPKTSKITVGGQQLTVAQIIGRIQAMLALLLASRTAANQLHQATRNVRGQEPAFRLFFQALAIYLKNEYGVRGAQLIDYGLVIKERRKPSPKTQVVAASKGVTTRTEHGILGPKQRAKITAPIVQVLGPDGKPLKGSGNSGQGNGQ